MVDFKSENMSSESYYPDSDFYNQDNTQKDIPLSKNVLPISYIELTSSRYLKTRT